MYLISTQIACPPLNMRSGFSLVELSIVLVILGLLVGGVLTGQSLIRAAELRSATTEFEKYQAAVHTFRDKYFALPGDMNNATAFWGSMTNCGVASPSGSGTQTCDGDGDGVLDIASAAQRTGEYFGFWRHLANAGLIEGTYSGIAGAGHYNNAVIGTNVPRAKLTNAGWYANKVGAVDANWFPIRTTNVFYFGTVFSGGGTAGTVLMPEEAWNIDTKMDDGLPGQGKVASWKQGGTVNPNCATTSDEISAQYDLGRHSIECSLILSGID